MAASKNNPLPNPVLVEAFRAGTVESIHRGSAVVFSLDGGTVGTWGDIRKLTFSRSAIKPLQAIPLVETGAADRFGVTETEIALACASHSGTNMHTHGVAAWLARLGLSERDLGCGPHWPYDADASRALAREGRSPTRLHNNCSGKHAGFITTALAFGLPIGEYLNPLAGIQQRVFDTLSEMCDVSIRDNVCGSDGCAAPAPTMPLEALAHGFARLAAPESLSKVRGAACARITRAMVRHPDLVAGPGRFDTSAARAMSGSAILKCGAEGVQAAALLDQGVGIALKIDDGATRAADAAMAALLRRVASIEPNANRALAALETASLENTAGQIVGEIRPADDWKRDLDQL